MSAGFFLGRRSRLNESARRVLSSVVFPGAWVLSNGGRCQASRSVVSPDPDMVMITTFRMLPFSLGASLFAAISGLIVTKTGKYRPVIWVSLIATIVGFGLMSTLDSRSNTFVIARTPVTQLRFTFSRAKKVLYPLVAAAGLGGLLQVCTESDGFVQESELTMMGRHR